MREFQERSMAMAYLGSVQRNVLIHWWVIVDVQMLHIVLYKYLEGHGLFISSQKAQGCDWKKTTKNSPCIKISLFVLHCIQFIIWKDTHMELKQRTLKSNTAGLLANADFMFALKTYSSKIQLWALRSKRVYKATKGNVGMRDLSNKVTGTVSITIIISTMDFFLKGWGKSIGEVSLKAVQKASMLFSDDQCDWAKESMDGRESMWNLIPSEKHSVGKRILLTKGVGHAGQLSCFAEFQRKTARQMFALILTLGSPLLGKIMGEGRISHYGCPRKIMPIIMPFQFYLKSG